MYIFLLAHEFGSLENTHKSRGMRNIRGEGSGNGVNGRHT